MEEKPLIINVLIGLWIAFIIIFTGTLIIYTTNYLDNNSGSLINDEFNTYMTFSFIMYFLLYLALIIVGIFVLYGTFFKKTWTWLISVMLSSFVGFFIFLGISTIGMLLIMNRFDTYFKDLFSSFTFITYLFTIFFVPCMLFILTRPTVKNYFEKTEKTINYPTL